MVYVKHDDGRTTWTRNGYMARGGNGLSRDSKKALGTAKPKEGSRRALKKECKSITAQLVKMRDGHQCQQCLVDGVMSDCVIDAGHVYPVSVFPGGEFDLMNIHGQCRRHNTIHIGQPELYMTWFQDKFGEEALEALHARALADPPTNDDLRRMIAERTAEVETLRLLAVA